MRPEVKLRMVICYFTSSTLYHLRVRFSLTQIITIEEKAFVFSVPPPFSQIFHDFGPYDIGATSVHVNTLFGQ